jgi:outer membrane protein assembly factor BamB
MLFTILCLALLPQAGSASNEEWFNWRGPLANGQAPDAKPPLTWDEQSNIKWKTAIPGRGHSTPIVCRGRSYLLTAIDTGRAAGADELPKSDSRFDKRTTAPKTFHQFVLVCVDLDSGKILWQRIAAEQVPHEGKHDTNTFASGSPATDGTHLYASFGSRGVHCYDLDGKPIWKRDFGPLHTRLGWGEAVTPVVADGIVVVNCDHEGQSFIVALDAKTGATKWQKDRGEKSSWATPLIVKHRGRTQVIINATQRVRAYDLSTGEVIWECGGQTVNAIPTPIVHGDHVICMSGYRGSYACAIPLDSQGDVTDKVLWKHDRGTPYVPSPLLLGDRVYFTQQNTPALTCLDARSGKVIIDRERLPGLNSIYASPLAALGRIYICGRNGTTLVLQAGDKVEILATNKLDDAIDASPVAVGKKLLIRGHTHLYCVEAR